jgi:F420-non-reducing hydrogenase iron-sulfur subunit
VEYTRQLLEECGLGADRLAMYDIPASEAPKWVAAVMEMTEKVKALGPNPMNPIWGPEAVVPEEQLELAVQR